MNLITREELANYQNLKRKIHACELEIKSMYDTYQSPQPRVDSGASSVRPANDTVANTVNRINERKSELEQMLKTFEEQTIRITKFVDQIEDMEVSAIAQAHFLAGKTWRETTVELYGASAAEHLSRIIFNRWANTNS